MECHCILNKTKSKKYFNQSKLILWLWWSYKQLKIRFKAKCLNRIKKFKRIKNNNFTYFSINKKTLILQKCSKIALLITL